jgi:iron complex outermembrane receptor protein
VHKYGFDGSVAWQASPALQFYVFGSYLWSKIQEDVLAGECGATVSASCPAGSAGKALLAPTEGRRESGAPVYTLGARMQANLGVVEVGLSAKRTGPRYVNDVNQPTFLCVNTTGGNAYQNVFDCPATATRFQVYGAKAPAYNIVNLDVRVPLEWAGLNDQTYFQLNVSNLFDEFFPNNPGGQLLNTSVPFVNIGAPRAVIGTLVVGFR